MTTDTTRPVDHGCEAATARTAPIALWRIAGRFLHVLHALFGAPEEIAAQQTLNWGPYTLLVSWLRCAEAMLRHLLLIEAQAYPKPNTRPLLHAKRQRVRKLMSFTPDKPEDWRVSFRCFLAHRQRPARLPKFGPRKPAKRISREDRWCTVWKPVKFRSAWPLAERYEALIRVFNDPSAYARRLARRLHATPHRAAEVLRAPPQAEARIDRYGEFREGAITAASGFGFRLDSS